MKTLAALLLLGVSLVPVWISAQTQAQNKPQAPAAAPAAQATNLTGDWNANFTLTAPDGRSQTITFTFHFTQKGKALTGTIGPEPARQWNVDKGVVDGSKVTFEVQQTDGQRPLRSFTLTLVKDRLQGTQKLSLPDGQTAEVTVDAGRAKAK